MADPGSEPIAVVGAGLAGSLMALTLAEEGHRVRLFERRGDIRLGTIFFFFSYFCRCSLLSNRLNFGVVVLCVTSNSYLFVCSDGPWLPRGDSW